MNICREPSTILGTLVSYQYLSFSLQLIIPIIVITVIATLVLVKVMSTSSGTRFPSSFRQQLSQ